jgi:RNA polymerase-interacting CarD/CdnL/TRCF family regulator
MTTNLLQVGDEVIHPRYGFGTVEALLARDRDGESVNYYEVRLAASGLLSVPVDQADDLGLRRLVNGVTATLDLIRANALPLPDHPRMRNAELLSRWQSPEPAALAGAVRDLLGHARQFGLKSGEQQWLTRACERLGAEAARVDGITLAAARLAITREVTRLKTPPETDAKAAAKPAKTPAARRSGAH